MINHPLLTNFLRLSLNFSAALILLFLSSSVITGQSALTQSLSLAEAINRARQQHPLLVVAKQRVAMMEAESMEAGLRLNPSLTISGENFPLDPPQDGFGISRTMDWFVTYSQTFERGHKRELRSALAARNLENAQAEAAATERHIIASVKAAYQQAVFARERVELLRELSGNLTQLVQLTAARVQEGYSAEGDLIKTRLEAQRSEYDLRKALIEYEKAKIHFLKSLGGASFEASDLAFTPADRLEFHPVSINAAALQMAAFQQPQVKAAEAKVERAQALVRLEQARARPDVTTTFGYKRNGADNTLYGAISVPLPLYNRNRAMIARAEAEVAAAEAELRYVRNVVLAELTAARRAVEMHEQQLEKLRADFLSNADESQRISLVAYREGATNLLTLLDAQRMRGQAQELWYQALYEYQLAVHDLERAADIERLPLKNLQTTNQQQENLQRVR